MNINIEPYKQKIISFLTRLSDIRFAGQVLFVIVVLLISWSGVKTIQSNYTLQKQITGLKQQNDVQKLRNTNLALQNDYLNSNQYLELAARQNFGLALPGEKELIVPKDVALTYTKDLPTDKAPVVQVDKRPAYQRNVQSWINFFFHRQVEN